MVLPSIRILGNPDRKLNARLFDRDKHGVSLTDADAELVPIARRMLSEFHDALNDLSEFITGRRGVINIWALPSVAAAVLPQASLAFKQSHPQVRLVVQATSAGQVVRAVSEGTAGIGLSIEHPTPTAGLSFSPLLEDHFVMICSKNDPLAHRKQVDWRIFTERPFIASGPVRSVSCVAADVLYRQQRQISWQRCGRNAKV